MEINQKEEHVVRMRKRTELLEKGVNPYPNRISRTHTIRQILEQFGELEKNKHTIATAGRLMLVRRQGGSTFANLKDESGEIQLFIRKDTIGAKAYILLNTYVDRGDFLSVNGVAFETKRGEKSILPSAIELIAKATLPLPEKWHGLKDTEERFRKRYLDILTNDTVKKRFEMRSRILELIRSFMKQEGYIEVDTPVLQPLYGGGLARPFVTHHHTLNRDVYLRVSSELYLKRLIVAGFEKVYEISKVFRNEGMDLSHNPEFTMFETMAAYEDYTYNMDLIERIYEYTAKELFGDTKIQHGDTVIDVARPWRRVRLAESIQEVTGFDFEAYTTLTEAKEAALHIGIPDKKSIDTASSIGQILQLLFEEYVEPTLIHPTIVYDYPYETSPLAKRCPADPRFAERFEQFILGKEHGNNYTELNDPVELAERFGEEQTKAKKGTAVEEIHQTDHDFIEAIGHGMPPTSGAGIGIDRMVMLFTGTDSIKEVILFPTMKPKDTPV